MGQICAWEQWIKNVTEEEYRFLGCHDWLYQMWHMRQLYLCFPVFHWPLSEQSEMYAILFPMVCTHSKPPPIAYYIILYYQLYPIYITYIMIFHKEFDMIRSNFLPSDSSSTEHNCGHLWDLSYCCHCSWKVISIVFYYL